MLILFMNINENDKKRAEELLKSYEDAVKNGRLDYFDVDDIEVMIDYLLSRQFSFEALEVVDYGLDIHRQDPSLLVVKAKLLLYIDFIARADLFIKSLIGNDSIDKFEMDLLIGELALKRGEKEKADELFAGLIDIDDDFKRKVAYAYFNSGYYDECAKYLNDILENDESDTSLMKELASCYEELNRYADAAKIYERVLDGVPYDEATWYKLGMVYYNDKDFDKAAQAFDYSYVIGNDKYSLMQVGNCYFQAGKFQCSLDAYLKFYEQDDSEEVVALFIAECYERLDRLEDAKDFYCKVLEMNDENDAAMFGLCSYLIDSEQYEEALTYADKILSLNGDNIDALLCKGECLLQLDRDEEAYNIYKHALDLNPNMEDVNFILGNFEVERGDYEIALCYYDKVSLGNENLITLPAGLAISHFKLGNHKIAYEYLIEAILRDKEMQDSFFEFCPEAKSEPLFKDIIEENNNEKFKENTF